MYIHDTRLRLLLLKTVPGADEQVLRQLGTEEVPFHSHTRMAMKFIVFGDYDIAILEVCKEKSQTHRGMLPDVLGAREVNCFAILESPSDKQRADELLSELGRERIVGFSFIRMRSIFRNPNQQHPDREFMEWWQAQTPPNGGRSLLLGTFGQPEFLCVHAYPTINETYAKILQTKDAGTCVDKTFSIIAVNLDSKEGAKDTKPPPSPFKLSLQVLVSCQPMHRDYLLASCRQALEASGTITDLRQYDIPGANDFGIVGGITDENRIADIARSVIGFRRDMSDLLLNTRTRILHELDPPDDSIPRKAASRSLQPIRMTLTAGEARLVQDRLADAGPMIVRALHAAGNLVRNELLVDDLMDMLVHIHQLRQRALELANTVDTADEFGPVEEVGADEGTEDPTPGSLSRTMEWLRASLTTFPIALHQRTAASFTGVSPQETSVSHLIGGSQKFLQAAESIPWSVWREWCRLHNPNRKVVWTGYVMFGLQQFQGTRAQVLRVPNHHTFAPHKWWPLVHEIGHCIYDHVRDKHVRDKEEDVEAEKTIVSLESGLHDVLLQHDDTKVSREVAARLVEEVVVDAIAALFGPIWNLELSLLGLWDALLRLPWDKPSPYKCYEYCLRASMLYANLREWDRGRGLKTGKVREYAVYDTAQLNLYVDSVLARGRRPSESDRRRLNGILEVFARTDRHHRRSLFEVLAPIATNVLQSFSRMTQTRVEERWTYWKTDCKNAVGMIEDGQPPDISLLRFPELFVWKLRDTYPDKMGYVQIVAAILGLRGSFRSILLDFLPDTSTP